MSEVQRLARAVAQANDRRDVLAVAEQAGVQVWAAAQALQQSRYKNAHKQTRTRLTSARYSLRQGKMKLNEQKQQLAGEKHGKF
jgi:hypothetical protein